MPGKLFVTATPIGDPGDITYRAVKVLTDVSFVICEDLREAGKLLSKLGLKKELVTLNEHDEEENTPGITQRILNGESAALISDCGTPMFADPGHRLLDDLIAFGVEVVPVPGTSSLTTALSVSGLHIEKFYYYGWLPVKKDARAAELSRVRKFREVVIFLETPYRLKNIMKDICDTFGRGIETVLAFDLTLPTEKIFRGSAGSILDKVTQQNLKGEFVLIVDNRDPRTSKK